MNDNAAILNPEATIISRREIEPVLLKASKLMDFYEKAVGCVSLVLDSNGVCVNPPAKKLPALCGLCMECHSCAGGKWKEGEFPCTPVHMDAIAKAHNGGVHIYACGIGFSYWISPLYAGGKNAGSLLAGQVLGIPKDDVIKKFKSEFKIPGEKLDEIMNTVTVKTQDEIQALSRMLFLCAGKISANARDSPVTPKKSSGSKPAVKTVQSAERDQRRAFFQDKERMLLAALRRGDMGTAGDILREILEIISKTDSLDFDFIRFRSIEMIVLLSRETGGDAESWDAYNKCFRRLTESTTVKELSDNIQYMIDQMGSKIFSFRGKCHASALRKAERFIWENYSRKISLNEIADASGLSAPYFSTIFKKEMGQNLSDYLNKLRIEKATGLLSDTGLPLNEIAKTCGFEDQSWFSKVFKNCMGTSPGRFREQGA